MQLSGLNESRTPGICNKRQAEQHCGRKNKTVKGERRRRVMWMGIGKRQEKGMNETEDAELEIKKKIAGW